MTNLLIISGNTPPDVSATGRIISAIAKEAAKNKEIQITMLSLTSDYSLPASESVDGITVTRVLTHYGKYRRAADECVGVRKAVLTKRVRAKILKIWQEKRGSENIAHHLTEMQRAAESIINTQSRTHVITVSNPFECHEIGFALKKKYADVRWIPYYMDSYSKNCVKPGDTAHEDELLTAADRIIIVPALKNDIEFCEKHKDKLAKAELPAIPVKYRAAVVPKDAKRMTFAFAGMFYEDVRSPIPLLDTFTALPDNYILHLYSRGCMNTVSEYTAKYPKRIIYHGFVSPDELEERLAASDFCVNVGNSAKNQVTSKIFDYIALGHPVINFYTLGDDDPGVGYLKRYPLALNLDAEMLSPEKMAEQIARYAKENRGSRLTYNAATASLEEIRLKNVVKTVLAELDATSGTEN